MRTGSDHREIRKVQFTDKSTCILLGRNFELADRTLDTAENILILEDDTMINIKIDRESHLHNPNLSVEDIRMTIKSICKRHCKYCND